MAKLNHPDLVASILAFVDKLLHVEKGQVLDAEGVKLHPSELHFLLFLHARPDANATDIARRFSVTKGAVSQTLSRLEAKGVLTKARSNDSGGALSITLTDLGEKLMPKVLGLQEAAAQRFDAHLASLTEADRQAVGRFLRSLTED